MYTNGNVGNTFDQYKISYNLLCIIIIIMQEVYITCPVFISTLIISVKRDLPCFAECCCGPGVVFNHACEGWSSAFCGALICNEDETADDHIISNTPPLLLDVHWPHNIWRRDHQQLQALEIAEAKRACQHQLA